jgi:hypothetical protein
MRSGAARKTVSLLLVVTGPLIACGVITEPMPDGTRHLSAPSVYQVWWSMTESCSRRSVAFSSIDWYVVPGVAQFVHNGIRMSGYWSQAGRRIVIAERAMLDGGLVRHEMLHAVLGKTGHSRDAFIEQCGGTVVCLAGCLDDVGPPPAIGINVGRVPASEMRVDVEGDPKAPEFSVDDGHFRLLVTVTNPRSDSVVVLLPSSGDAPPASFSFQLSGGRTGVWFTEHAWDAGVMVFGPGATRRAVFDFTLADRFDGFRAIPAGTYQVRGGFGPASSITRSLDVGLGR